MVQYETCSKTAFFYKVFLGMYFKLSLIVPFVVITLLGRPVQAFINLIFILSSVFSFAFVNFEQGFALYLASIFHSIFLVYLERRSKKNNLFQQVADKIINE